MIIYSKYGYRLFESIKGIQWGETEIENRGKYLAQKCLLIWQNFNDQIVIEGNTSTDDKIETKTIVQVIANDDVKFINFKGKRKSLKYWKDLLIFTIQEMEKDNPKKFRNIVYEDLEYFSEIEKPNFIFIEKANIFVKYKSSAPITAEKCHEFRIKMGWSTEDYLGEGVRKKQGTATPFYFS